MTHIQKIDNLVACLIAAILVYSAVILGAAYLAGTDLGTWVWDRHQNQFSWYSRPLFIIPAAYYAYRRKLAHVAGFMLLLKASLFWFAAPTTVPPEISEYLAWEEKLFFSNDDKRPLIALIIAVAIFLFLLFYAFWKRNVWYGLAVINLGTLLKVAVSIGFGEDAGMAAVLPSLSSLLVINVSAWLWLRRQRSKSGETR